MQGILWILAFACLARTQTIPRATLAWDPQANVAGYILRYGTASGAYTQVIDVGTAPTYTIFGLSPTVTYFFVVTAYDQFGVEGAYSDEVQYTVPNQGPTISAIPSQVTPVNVSTPAIPFLVGDIETPGSLLVIVGSSSNPLLVPVSGIHFSGNGSNRTVTVTPLSNRIGEANITLCVKDGNGGRAVQTFVVIVNPVGTGPTLDVIEDMTIQEDAGLQTLALTGISSGATNFLTSMAASITALSDNAPLIPNPLAAYADPEQTGTLSFTNVPGQSGKALITVMVCANLETMVGFIPLTTMVRSFTVTVIPMDSEAPSLDRISDRTIFQDAGPQTIGLTGISAGQINEFANLTLTADSSNPDLIPIPAIDYAGPDSVGTLSFTPVLHATGSSTITVFPHMDEGATQGGVEAINRSFMVTILPLPELRIKSSGNEVNLSWPASNSGFVLEWTQSLFPAAWNPVPDAIQSQNSFKWPATEGGRFFRLRKP